MKMTPVQYGDTGWPAWRCGNLVYYRNYKCATTFYLHIFKTWEEITTHDIDWEKDHVFSYIRDPIERYRSGIAEFLFSLFRFNITLKDDIINDSEFKSFRVALNSSVAQ